MSKIPLPKKIRESIEWKIRDMNSRVCNWVLRVQSQPLKVSNKPAIVFAPHQDDETIGCGGMIALKRSQGIPVKVVFLTDGRYGRPEWIKAEEIIQVRQQEALSALDNLGIEKSQTYFLGYTDGSLAQLTSEQRQQLIDYLVALLKSFQPGEIYVPHSKDGHPDHEATYEVVQMAIAQSETHLELLQYPIWIFWYNVLPFKLCLQYIAHHAYRLCISSVHEQKKQAISRYKSQVPNIPNSLLTSFFAPYEIFIKN
ncbi:GlcNAc-PI de-N-acetylase [Nostocales cyanobacterium HT-58-2]|nr:GlcNAc-PI de-N-acetylase [Nostocales cyanobacterium HT-58-2]